MFGDYTNELTLQNQIITHRLYPYMRPNIILNLKQFLVLVLLIWTSSTCIVPNCQLCITANPNQCQICISPLGVLPNSLCGPCALSNCASCPFNSSLCQQCEPSFTYNSVANQCLPCVVGNCSKCSNNTVTCEQCLSGFSLQSNGCVENPCSDPQCIYCPSNKSLCSNCNAGYVISFGSCVPECNVYDCISCNSPNNCSDCSAGFTAINGSCASCAVSNCQICNATDTCKRCNAGFSLANSACYSCEIPNCRNCQQNNKCKSCNTGYTLSNNTCSQIPSPIIPDPVAPEQNKVIQMIPFIVSAVALIAILLLALGIFLVIRCRRGKKYEKQEQKESKKNKSRIQTTQQSIGHDIQNGDDSSIQNGQFNINNGNNILSGGLHKNSRKQQRIKQNLKPSQSRLMDVQEDYHRQGQYQRNYYSNQNLDIIPYIEEQQRSRNVNRQNEVNLSKQIQQRGAGVRTTKQKKGKRKNPRHLRNRNNVQVNQLDNEDENQFAF